MSKEFIIIEGADNKTLIRATSVVAAYYWGLTLYIETEKNTYDWELDSEEDLEEIWNQILQALDADEIDGEFPPSDLH